jgi:hypothetical protein
MVGTIRRVYCKDSVGEEGGWIESKYEIASRPTMVFISQILLGRR